MIFYNHIKKFLQLSITCGLENFYFALTTIIATHYHTPSTLEKETSNFMNYKVSVVCHPDGSISYPFTLERGISDQHIAIDILRLDGFSSEILDTAYAMINER